MGVAKSVGSTRPRRKIEGQWPGLRFTVLIHARGWVAPPIGTAVPVPAWGLGSGLSHT